jgi:hypothetical protein
VDGHRTVAQAISPYTRRRSRVSLPYNHTSFARTIGLTLGFPAMNRFDRSALSLAACFTNTPNFTPYVARPARVPLDELNPPLKALRGEVRKLAEASARLDMSDVDRADPEVISRAVWRNRKPNAQLPATAFKATEEED